MHSRIYPLAATALVLCATVGPAFGQVPAKQSPAGHASAKLAIQPGQTARWQSPNIGPINNLSLTIGGREAFYQVEPHTHSCVAYGYEAGVAIRITDCVKGRRVPYVRIRSTSAALKPVRVVLRLNGG